MPLNVIINICLPGILARYEFFRLLPLNLLLPMLSAPLPHAPGLSSVRRSVLLFCVLGLGSHLPAQSTSAGTDPKTITLSPFQVKTTVDTGYAAQETLSGTRMRTDLRDVGAAMAILTPEFLEDLGLNAFNEALLYTPSVNAVNGENSNLVRGEGNFVRFGKGNTYSIRGFVNNVGDGQASADFFPSLVPGDAYNVERLTLSRGANSILFGVGGADGVSVQTTKRAMLNRRQTVVNLQTDRWGSRRVALDHNQPLVKDVASLRLNALYGDKREFREHEGSVQERITLGLSLKPFAGTQVTINHESYYIGNNRASLQQVFDRGAINWVAAGRPTVDFSLQAIPGAANRTWPANSATAYRDASGNPVPVYPGTASADGFIRRPADFAFGNQTVNGGATQILTQLNPQTVTYVTGLDLPTPFVNYRYSAVITNPTFGGLSSQRSFQSIDPYALYGIPRDIWLYPGTRDDPAQRLDGYWTQVIIEQKLAENLFLELGANQARERMNTTPDSFNLLTFDVNKYLPNGMLNPGFQQPFATSLPVQQRRVDEQLEDYRASLAYERDFSQHHRWLGRHSFGLLTQRSVNEQDQDVLRAYNLASVGLAGWNANPVNANHAIGRRAYIINGQVPLLPGAGYQWDNLSAFNNQGPMIAALPRDSVPVSVGIVPVVAPFVTRNETESLSFAWQAKWWEDRVVTLYGYRQDSVKSYAARPQQKVFLPLPNGGTAGIPTFDYARNYSVNPEPLIDTRGISRTFSGVYHATSWLSLTYNQSANFTPVANPALRNFQNQPAPNGTGDTREYGVRLYLLDNKLSVALARFENSSRDQVRNANSYIGGARQILSRLRDNYRDAGDPNFATLAEAAGYTVDTGNASDTWSFDAEGYELTVIYNPSRNWRISLTGSQNTNTQGVVLESLREYLYKTTEPFQGLATWRNYVTELRKIAGGQASAQFALNPASATDRNQARLDADFIELRANSVESAYLDEEVLRGITTSLNGKYAFNGVTRYSFSRDTFLRGWAVGGNFRWRSAPIVGYERVPDPVTNRPGLRKDVSRPISGVSTLDLGAMVSYDTKAWRGTDLRIQLNVQNLLNETDPVLMGVDSDTYGVYGSQDALVPIRYILVRPRNFVLSAKFTF